jgi:hypothetical protein
MKTTEPDEDLTGLPFRDLFSEDETRAFFRPVFQLPTRRIAFWSIGLSVLLAVALVISSLSEQNRSAVRQKPVPVFSKKSQLRPAKRSKTDTTMYLRQRSR